MKIVEIISESNIQQESVWDKIAGLFKGAGKAADTAAQTGTTAGRSSSHVERIRAQRAEAARVKAAKEQVYADRALLTRHYSDEAISWINFFGLANIVYNYYAEWQALKAQYPEGGPEFDTAYRNLIGLSLAQWIAPKVAMKLADLKGIRHVLGILPGMVRFLRMPNAAEMIRAISSASGRAAAVYFFQSDEGKKWLTELMGGVVVGTLGNAGVLAGNFLKAIAGYAADIATGAKSPSEVWDEIKSDAADVAKAAVGASSDVDGTSSGANASGSAGKAPDNYDPNKLNSWDFSLRDIKR